MNGRAAHPESTLTIDRMHSVYLVPREHPAPDRMRGRLDSVLQKRLAASCRNTLARVLDPDDSSIWLIRKLDIDFALNLDVLDEDVLARVWAQRIGIALTRTIARGADGINVLCFQNQTEYLTQFILDLVEGAAWNKWYYKAFDTLETLPTGTAIREALLREPARLVDALLRIAARGMSERVLSSISDGDALKLYEVCREARADSADASGSGRIIDALLAVWRDAPLRVSGGRDAPLPVSGAGGVHGRNSLRLYLRLLQSAPGIAANARTHDAIHHLLSFAAILNGMDAPGVLLALLAGGDLRAAVRHARSVGQVAHLESLPFILEASSGDAKWLAEVARTVLPVLPVRPAKDEREALTQSQTFVTEAGGLFLLLPSLLALGVDELIAAAPYETPEDLSCEQLLRYFVALKCLGRRRTIHVAHDYVFRFALGLTHDPSFEDLETFSAAATEEADQCCRRMLLDALLRCGRVEGRALAAELVSTPGRVEKILLLRDAATDAWIDAAYIETDAEVSAALKRGLTLMQEVSGVAPEYLLLGAELAALLDRQAFAADGLRLVLSEHVAGELALPSPDETHRDNALTLLTTETDAIPASLRQTLADFVARAKPAAQELDYFSLTGMLPPVVANARFDLTWTLVARAVLKEFANRLMGFGWSSAEYLFQNFLGGASVVCIEGEEVEVRLPHSPLQIILRMAGVNGQSYTLSWLNNTQITLSLMPG